MTDLLARQLAQLGLSADVPPTPEQWSALLTTIQTTYADAHSRQLAKLVAAYDAVIEAAIDGVIVTDANGGLVRYSRRFLELWGLPDIEPSASLETRVARVAQRTADPTAFIEQTQAICSDDELESSDEIPLADGRTIERLSSPIRSEGHVIGRVWFFRDVSARKRHEAELHRLSDERTSSCSRSRRCRSGSSIRCRSRSSPSTTRWSACSASRVTSSSR